MVIKSNHSGHARAFTLIELVIVMAVLTTVLAVVVPLLFRSFQQRHLGQEADRLLALIGVRAR